MATFTSVFPTPFLPLSKPSSFPFCSLQIPNQKLQNSSNNFHTLRFCIPNQLQFTMMKKMKNRSSSFRGTVCSAIHPETLQWACTVSSVVLMLVKGTSIQKSFLVPFFALQAPTSLISWVRGEYGTWAAFLALLVRLFYFIPAELELPLLAALIVIVAPYQPMDLRGTQVGTVISLAIAAYLAFQHFSRVGKWQGAFEQGSIIATIAIICLTCIPGLLLF